MGRKPKRRRQSHGSAWHWTQTDCWYYTLPGTRKRVALFDDQGERIRGKENREAAELALARERVAWNEEDGGQGTAGEDWLVAKVCSDYVLYCERGVSNKSISKCHFDNTTAWLNDLCQYCGALPVAQLKKGNVQEWVDRHESWRSPATQATVIAVVQAAFNRAEEMFGIANPLKGLKKPKATPRLASLSPEDEKALYGATETCFGDFLFAAIHTGLRPICELAKLTADDIEESDRGMMWRVYSSKTKKTRKIPVRPEVAELTRKLMKTARKGSKLPIFRNTQGNPWKGSTGVARFLTVKEKLGWDQDSVKAKYSCYTCRHTFAHRMLSGYWNNGAGCTIETLAELIGDTPKVAFDHYGKEWGQHYQETLWNAIGERPPANDKSANPRSAKAKGNDRVDRKSKSPKKRPAKKHVDPSHAASSGAKS